MAGRRIDYLMPSLVASFGRAARLPPTGVRFISEVRPLIAGPAKLVGQFSEDEIVTGVMAHWTRGGPGGTGVYVAYGGGVMSAHGVLRETAIDNGPAYLESAVVSLVSESRRLDPSDPFRALLGEDVLGQTNPITPSSGERLLRLLESLVTATGEATTNGLNPTRLFDRDLIASTLRFVRGHIVRNGMTQGLGFELVQAIAKGRLPMRLPPWFQVSLPGIKKPHSLTNGYDGLLEGVTDLVPEELKAVSLARRAAAGKVKPHWIGATLDSLHGPDILEQVVGSRYRNSLWDHMVPGEGVARPWPTSLPANTAGWRRVSPVTIALIHSEFLAETAAELVAITLWNARKATLTISRDFDAPGAVKTQLRAIVGGPTIARDMPRSEFRDLALAWIARQVPVWQDGINTELDTAAVRAIVNMPTAPTVRLAGSHEFGRIWDIYTDLGVIIGQSPTAMSLGDELATLVAPLVDACSSPQGADRLLRDLGVVTATAPPPAVPEALTALAGTAQATIDAVLALDDPDVSAAERTLGLVTGLAALGDAIAELAALGDQDIADLAGPFDAPELWSYLAWALPGYLFTRWLRERHRGVFDPLALLGVVVPGEGGSPAFDLDRLTTVLSDAAPWKEALADPGVLVHPLRRRLDARGVTAASPAWSSAGPGDEAPVELPPASGERIDLAVPAGPGRLGLTASVEAVEGAAGPGLAVTVEGLDRMTGGIALGDGWALAVTGGPGLGGAVLGAGWAEPLDGDATLDSATVELAGRPPVPWALVGDPGATRVELGALTLALGGEALTTAPEVAFEVGTDGLRLVIVPGDGDSFLASLLGGDIVVELALNARWSPADGVSVDGAAGLTVHIATNITLGPLTISGLTFTLSAGGGVVALIVTTEIGGAVGPLSASVHGMGLRVELLDADARGPGIIRLGPVSLAFSFEPPDGACLSLALETVKGGGCLFFDRELGRYSGVVELELLGVGICAIIIIDTKALASGEWSLFFALFIDLPAIQLGFGFALTGVGGLAGINRDLDQDALSAAVRSGSMDSVLFPANPIDDAPQVIAELSAIFPPKQDRYVFGPVVRLAWGTPPLVEAELGIVLSLPDPVVVGLIGSVTSTLPTEDLDLVALHLDIGGGFDAAAGTLWIDAELHDSHIVFFALTGGMAVRSGFAGQPSFLMALGGFHPGFDAPDDFPVLHPLSLAISAAPVLDISFSCYMAITSNSVQFGSTFHLSAQIAGFGIEGGASFDALIEFSPFLLSTRLGWYVAVTAAGVDLAGVWLEASVDGPNPWLIVGTATFKILGFEEHVRIDERIGSRQAEPALDPVELLDALAAALAEEGAWSTVAGTSPGVVVTGTAPGPDELVVLPDGVVTVAQRAVPLGLRLDKAGDAPLGEHDTFTVEPGEASLTSSGTVQDWFAPGYFFELAAGERLSSPSFERLQAGIEFGGGEAVAGVAHPGTLEYEQILRDPELDEDRVDLGIVDLSKDVRAGLLTMTAGGGATAAGFAIAADDDAVSLQGSAYAVVHRATGVVQARSGTWAGAHQSEPGGRANTVVVPSWEAPS